MLGLAKLRSFSRSMKILLLEDENKVRSFLLETFEREGFTTYSFAKFSDAQEFVASGDEGFDVAILDRIVGEKDGAALVPVIKNKIPKAKVLILSAITSPDERAKLLDIGADDYMGKPYSIVELISRLRALVRRSTTSPSVAQDVRQIGDLEIHMLDHRVRCQGKQIDLTPKEFKLLAVLAESPGKVWSKYKLLDLVWNINLDIESNVAEATIKNLRRKLELGPSKVKIESKRNLGYWLEA